MQKFTDLIGNTPLVEIDRVVPDVAKANNVRVLLKMEMDNPGGSVKDRIAKHILEQAEKNGKLKPGMTVVEYTSGNTGIGLAMLCAAKGYKCICVMPQVPFVYERYTICRQFGAEVHLTAPAKGTPGLVAYTEQLLKDNPDYFFANQFYSEDNPDTHYITTGPEIWEQTGGKVDYFVTGVGTGGTAFGAGKFLVEKNPDCKVVCVEPSESRVHTGAQHKPHNILGIGAGVVTHFLGRMEPDKPFQEGGRGHVSEFAHCSSTEAIEMALRATREEGIMLAPTSGATLKVGLEIAQRPEAAGKTIVVICASHAIRYTKHPLWKEVTEEGTQALPVPPNMSPDAELLQWKSEDHHD